MGCEEAVSAEEKKLAIEIAYCTRCHFLPRASWIAQELLHTYADYISGLTLVPDHGGILEIKVNGEVVFSNKEAGRYPEIRELKESINRYLDEPEVATLKRHPGKT
jgi:selenoprotein W-related protein